MVKNRSKLCIILSLAIFAVALIMTLTGNGINVGVDFAGGVSVKYKLPEKADASKVYDVLHDMDLVAAVTVQGADSDEIKLQIKDISKYADYVIPAAVTETPAATEEPVATEVPATEAPAAEAAVTEAPATEAPAAEAAVTEAPATEAPAAEAAVTETPAATEEAAVTEAPAATAEAAAVVETSENEADASMKLVTNFQHDFETRLVEKYPNYAGLTQEGEVSYVGPVAGATLLKNALLSVLLATALMLIYIAFRFDFNSGVASVLGLLHDVLMMLSFMVLLRSIIQMNSSFIAAALTIVGYSINNTIVIFDRIRENARKMGNDKRVDVVRRSVKESLGRTLTTTATTLATIVLLYVLGVEAIKEFALPIIIGIVSGVYSANMINGYVWAFLEEKKLARKAKKA